MENLKELVSSIPGILPNLAGMAVIIVLGCVSAWYIRKRMSRATGRLKFLRQILLILVMASCIVGFLLFLPVASSTRQQLERLWKFDRFTLHHEAESIATDSTDPTSPRLAFWIHLETWLGVIVPRA